LKSWKIHKFGGTSVLNADRYKNVFQILTELQQTGAKAVVVSAMKGVTDDLIKAVDWAKAHREDYQSLLKAVHSRHIHEVSNLLDKTHRDSLLQKLELDFIELQEILRGVWLVKNAGEHIVERVSGMGEVWSAQILNAFALQRGVQSHWLDARLVLVVNQIQKRVVIDWEESQRRLNEWMQKHPLDFIVVTGFVAATSDGTITTLGRNGSDYSASIFGKLLKANEIYIWTDVDGVMSADPRLVPEAEILHEMSYHEVAELAYFGAKVVHPSTMAPAIALHIPIWIKNSLNPSAVGTKIHINAKSDRSVKGFSTIDQMCLLNIEGTGMVGIPGVAERLFSALRTANVSVVLISQASSEQSICLAIAESDADGARLAVQSAFATEISKGLIQSVTTVKSVSILAAVGDNMAHSPGISGKFFTALGQCGVNVRAIAQGSSERNISAVIDTKDAQRALRTVHSSFVIPHQVISIGVIGAGLIGGTFLRQLNEQSKDLRESRKIDVQVRAIANSKRMYLSDTPIDLNRWQDLLNTESQDLDLKRMVEHVRPSHIPHAVIIESTASSALAPNYCEWLEAGLHIISPNKKANTASLVEYQKIRQSIQKAHRHFLYSTNVGAGLPILQTIRDLSSTGDEFQMVQGIFSGTLSFIFNQYDGNRPFSEIVLEAKQKGYTEPDPRDDLSGEDVGRKLVIVAREAGLKLEVSDVKIESLVPAQLQRIPLDEFLKRIGEMDSPMLEKINQAKKSGQVLRFVGSIDNAGQAEVRLNSLPNQHAFAGISGTDNIVLFKTKRYAEQPLVIRGPGAGPEVTAAGVFADLLRLSKYLGSLS
jgi:aspartokinase/homoserine dehydrogenase 1